MGGRSPLRVFVQGSPDLVDTVFSKDEGGRKLDIGLADLVHEEHAGAFRAEVSRGPHVGIDGLLEQLPAPAGQDLDIVLLSLQLDVVGSRAVEEFRGSFVRTIDSLKSGWGAHVLVLGASSVDPDDDVHDYHGIEDTPATRIHRFNLAILEIAMQTGISIIDVDRIIAELGGAQHVLRVLDYSPEAHRTILRELHRVIADIGFFEARPLMPQIGRA